MRPKNPFVDMRGPLIAVIISISLIDCGGPKFKSDGDYRWLAADPAIPADMLRPSPADGDTALTDPPGFNWLPEEGAVGFILEIARDPAFPQSSSLLNKAARRGSLAPGSLLEPPLIVGGDQARLVARLPLNLHRPAFKLGPGEWYWRWYCVFEDGQLSPPSAGRRFLVSGEALEFQAPPVADLLSRIPDRHPRLFLRPENLNELRKLRVTSAAHGRLWKRIEASAVELMKIPLMEEPPPYPEGMDETYPLWRKYYDQARKMGQVLDFLGFCYLISEEPKWAERARDWLMHLTTWDMDGTSSITYNDEVAMPIVLNGARAYDWIYDFLSEDERKTIRDMLIRRGDDIYYKRHQRATYYQNPYGSHNTRTINYLGQAATVLYGESDAPARWLGYVIPIVTTFYPPWGGRHGGYSEGPSYWQMYFNYMLQNAFCLQTAMGIDILKKPFYRNDGWYKIYIDPPHAAQHPFGDTGIGAYWPADKINLYRLATVYDNPYFRWRAEVSPPDMLPVDETVIPTGVVSYFWLDEDPGHVEPKPPTDLPKSRVFWDTGLVGLHEDLTDPDEVFFLLRSSPFGAWSHSYADQNAFYIQGFGEALAIQSGYYPHYGTPHHTTWTWHTHAHNSVLVDGVGQKIRDRASRGRIIEFVAGSGEPGSVDYVAADAGEAYEGRLNKFVRRVYYNRPHEFLIVDELEAPDAARFDWLLHALNRMRIDRESQTVTIAKGKARLTARFISPEGLTFSQSNRFTEPPEDGKPNQWHLTVSTPGKSKATTFMVHLKVWRAG